MKLLVSACLLGVHCRYDGKSNTLPQLTRLLEEYTCIPVCPEMLGGLPTPRVPAERQNDRVVTQNGEDVTEAFVKGTAETLRLAKLCGCTVALLKENSPSCGCGAIYDGSFSGQLVAGDGLTAQMLKKYGITVYGESQLEALLPEDDLIFGTMMGFREELREEERIALKAAREAAEAKAKAEAEAAAAAAAKAIEEEAAARAAQDAAVAAALAEDSSKPFGDFPAVSVGEDFSSADDDSNPFADLLHLGTLERVSKPEPASVPLKKENIVYLTITRKDESAVVAEDGQPPAEGAPSQDSDPNS